MAGGDLTWRGAQLAGRPAAPGGYRLLSASLNGIWGMVAGLAVAGLLLGFLAARYPSARLPRLGRRWASA